MVAEVAAKNILLGNGGHGLKEAELIEALKGIKDLEKFLYTMSKCPKDYLTVHPISGEKPDIDKGWHGWFGIEEKYNEDWGFTKSHPGCYIYALFEDGPPEEVNPIFADVIYIGESRAVSRDSMYGRSSDFRSTIKNDAVRNPYGNGLKFKELFGKEKLKHVYRAFLPCDANVCKSLELDILKKYYKYNGRIPFCNSNYDDVKVKKFFRDDSE